MRPPSPSLPEKDFLLAALAQARRIDGRALLDMRTPLLAFGTDLGNVECALGKTRSAAAPRPAVAVPLPSDPPPPACSHRSTRRWCARPPSAPTRASSPSTPRSPPWRRQNTSKAGRCAPPLAALFIFTPPHRPSDEEVALARMLDKVVRRSDTIDKESLCVLAGQRVRPPTPARLRRR